jgi:hypothetical protein
MEDAGWNGRQIREPALFDELGASHRHAWISWV